jgi:hypothetical protein
MVLTLVTTLWYRAKKSIIMISRSSYLSPFGARYGRKFSGGVDTEPPTGYDTSSEALVF